MRVIFLFLAAACASSRADAPTRTVVVIGDPAPPAEDAPCTSDADCAFTRVGAGEKACCPMLCTPRVVTKKRAKELEDRIPACSGGRACPQPACKPPRAVSTPACVEKRCIAKRMAEKDAY